jgi:hypothetical protein
VAVLEYIVECRRVSGWADPWFYVHDAEGTIVAFDQDWRRMLHVLEWWPMPGLEPGQAIPREEATPRPKPRTIQIHRGHPDALPLFGEGDE